MPQPLQWLQRQPPPTRARVVTVEPVPARPGPGRARWPQPWRGPGARKAVLLGIFTDLTGSLRTIHLYHRFPDKRSDLNLMALTRMRGAAGCRGGKFTKHCLELRWVNYGKHGDRRGCDMGLQRRSRLLRIQRPF